MGQQKRTMILTGGAMLTALAFGLVGVASANDLLPIDPGLGSASGWAGVGLLGVVLHWVAFRYIPDQRDQMTLFIKNKDEQLSAFMKDKDVQVQALAKIHADAQRDVVQRFTAAFDEQRGDFREMLGLPKKA